MRSGTSRNAAEACRGQLMVDVAGNGSIRFQVPDVRPGRYRLFVLCPGCALHSAGRTFVPVADFQVTDPSGRHRRPTVRWVPVAAGAIAGLLLVTAAWERGRRSPAVR